MKFVDFKESNFTYTGGGLEDEHGRPVGDLKVFRDENKIISKWRLTWRERLGLLFHGTVWLYILGRGMPPVTLEVKRKIFEYHPPTDETPVSQGSGR
jgi:hypothetical protein